MRCFHSAQSLLRQKNGESELLSPFCKVNLCGALEFSFFSSLLVFSTPGKLTSSYFPRLPSPFLQEKSLGNIQQQSHSTLWWRVENGGNENVMVNGENLFYIQEISLRLSHPY